MYKYFISYNVTYRNHSGFGMSETETEFKITGVEAIRRIAKSIEKDWNYPEGSVIIINWKPFEKEATTSETT